MFNLYKNNDKRADLRLNFILDFTIQIPKKAEIYQGVSRNFSHRGILLQTDMPFTEGSLLQIHSGILDARFAPLHALLTVLRSDFDTATNKYLIAGKIIQAF